MHCLFQPFVLQFHSLVIQSNILKQLHFTCSNFVLINIEYHVKYVVNEHVQLLFKGHDGGPLIPFPLAPVSSVVLVTKFVARSFRYSCLVLLAIALNFSDLWAAFSAFMTAI